MNLPVVGLVLVSLYSSCADHAVDVEFYRDDGHRFSWTEQWLIESIAEDTVAEVAQLLPSLPPSIVVRVHQDANVVAATGDRGSARAPNIVQWIVSPDRPEGISAVARARLRTTLYHHLFYLARRVALDEPHTVLNESVAFGLATVFARDFGDSEVSWNTYPRETSEWVPEVLAVANEMTSNTWMSRLPDGRRFVGPSVGTYVVEQAIAAGGSVVDLVAVPSATIVLLAGSEVR